MKSKNKKDYIELEYPNAPSITYLKNHSYIQGKKGLDIAGYIDKQAEGGGLDEIKNNLNDDDLLIIRADHGNDPTYQGSDHTRENTPVLIYNKNFKNPTRLPNLKTFADLGATIADNFNLFSFLGTSFLESLK